MSRCSLRFLSNIQSVDSKDGDHNSVVSTKVSSVVGDSLKSKKKSALSIRSCRDSIFIGPQRNLRAIITELAAPHRRAHCPESCSTLPAAGIRPFHLGTLSLPLVYASHRCRSSPMLQEKHLIHNQGGKSTYTGALVHVGRTRQSLMVELQFRKAFISFSPPDYAGALSTHKLIDRSQSSQPSLLCGVKQSKRSVSILALSSSEETALLGSAWRSRGFG